MTYIPPNKAATQDRITIPVTKDFLQTAGPHSVTTADILALVTFNALTETIQVVELNIMPDVANVGTIDAAFADGSTFTIPNGSIQQSFGADTLQPASLNNFVISALVNNGFRITCMVMKTPI